MKSDMQSMTRVVLAAVILAMAVVVQAAPENVISRNGVSYVSGGIGADSQQRLKALESEFNLKLIFTLVEGNYVSDVTVAIRDGGGRMLVEHVADGPFLLAKLPVGKYTVSAIYEGKTQIRQISVKGGRLQTEYLRWPGNPETDFALPPEHRQPN